MKKMGYFLIVSLLSCILLYGCGNSGQNVSSTAESSGTSSAAESSSTIASSVASSSASNEASVNKLNLDDGYYMATLTSQDAKFQVNTRMKGLGNLIVEDSLGNISVTLNSNDITKVFVGTAQDAQKEGASVLEARTTKFNNSNGTSEVFNAFLIPVPDIEKEYDCAYFSTDNKWHDNKIKLSGIKKATTSYKVKTAGEYPVEFTCESDSGSKDIISATIIASANKIDVKIVMDSNKYSEIKVSNKSYKSIEENGKSTFTFPADFDNKIDILASADGNTAKIGLKLKYKSLPNDSITVSISYK